MTSDTPRIPLTIVVLSHNEADTIKRCLTSISWCNDVILLDDSSDETVEIAKKIIPESSLRIVSVSERADFAKLRNVGLEKARHEWVLFLDADEVVSEELYEELDSSATADGNDSDINGYYLKRKDFFLGKWLASGETRDVRLLKLGKKSAGSWKRRVHEVWNIKEETRFLHSPLLHYPHPTLSEFLSRINRWTDIDAQVFYDQGIRSNWWKIIGYPVGKFLRNYFLKQGFRDGMPGLIMALMMSLHSFLTRAKLFFLQRNDTKS